MGKNRNGNGFPGSLAVSILREDFTAIEKGQYKILLKSDGTRYAMFVFEYPGGDGKSLNVVDLLDRSFTHHIVSAAFAKNVYQGTLFDGELVKMKDGTYQYQIFDCLAYCGTYIGNDAHHVRLSTAAKCISSQYEFSPANHTFQVVVKNYFTPKEALCGFFEEMPYPIDGWILQDVNRPYVSGKDTFLFKYKKVGKYHPHCV